MKVEARLEGRTYQSYYPEAFGKQLEAELTIAYTVRGIDKGARLHFDNVEQVKEFLKKLIPQLQELQKMLEQEVGR